MSLAEAQLRSYLADGEVGVGAVFADEIHGFLNIPGLRSGADFLNPQLGRLHLTAQPVLKVQNGLFQIAVVEGFQQEIHSPQPQGLLGIGEAVIGSQDDDKGIVSGLAQPFQHFKTVHFGHFQVGDDQSRAAFCGHFQTFFPIGGLADNNAVQTCPVHGQHDPLTNQLFILYDHNFQHLRFSFLYGQSGDHAGAGAILAVFQPKAKALAVMFAQNGVNIE